MLLAGMGHVRPPGATAVEFGGRVAGSDSAAQLWRFFQDSDTLDYRVVAGPPRMLEAEWRRRDQTQARSRTQLDVHQMPASARIDFPEGPARFELTVVAGDTAAAFDPAIWRGPP